MNSQPLMTMKHFTAIRILTGLLLTATALQAGEIPWSTFTGGGGIAQHGAVALGGAIGPIAPALSPATGGHYTLTGGFWPALSGQPNAVAPILTIFPLNNGAKVRLSWPLAVNGFTLEYTPQLGSGIWITETAGVVNTAAEHTVTVPAPEAFRCYRLRSQ